MVRYNLIFLTCLFFNSLYSQVEFNIVKQAQVTGLPGGNLSNIWGYKALDGKEYAIVGSITATNFYDVTNCGNPILKTSIIDGISTSWREYKTYKKYAYSVSEGSNSGGLKMFDMTNIQNGVVLFSQRTFPRDTFFRSGHTVSIDTINARMYVSGAHDGTTNNSLLYIYQLYETRLEPTLLRKVKLNDMINQPNLNLYIHDLYVENNIVYASHGNSGFYIWDCTDPQNIVLLGSNDDNNPGTNVNGYNHSTWRHPFHPEYFYCAEETADQPMIVYKVTQTSTAATITIPKTFKDPLGAPTFNNNIYHNPHIVGNGLYISAYNDGIQLYDISSPESPVRVGYYDTYPQRPTATQGYNGFNGAWGVYPFLPSGCILASDINNGFFTMKTKFPKINFNGNLDLSSTVGAGIIFKDSLNQLKHLFVNSVGVLTVANYTGSLQNNYRADSADVEIVTPLRNIYLKGNNEKIYKVEISNTGNFFLSQAETTIPLPKTSISNNIFIDNKEKGLILTSSNGQRWKATITKAGNLKTTKTAF
ncbi:MAG: hypothetical protein RLZZ546_661 [Bacteroidota bacterium]|jgi:choice-of-anchor B domain-containing protein